LLLGLSLRASACWCIFANISIFEYYYPILLPTKTVLHHPCFLHVFYYILYAASDDPLILALFIESTLCDIEINDHIFNAWFRFSQGM
jgi:hypothetical protein